MLSQLNLDSNILLNNSSLNKSGFGQLYLIAYFFKKMIFAQIQYNTYNAKFLVIIKIFKT